jgi:hypothetical protein
MPKNDAVLRFKTVSLRFRVQSKRKRNISSFMGVLCKTLEDGYEVSPNFFISSYEVSPNFFIELIFLFVYYTV